MDDREPDERPRLTRRASLVALASTPGLALLGSSVAQAGTPDKRTRHPRPTLGLALGGGGAKGLAHISALQALEELGVVADRVVGTSAGALVGALYAGGLSPTTLRRELATRFAEKPDRAPQSLWERYMPRDLINVAVLMDPTAGEGGFLRGELFVDAMLSLIRAQTFEELKIPLAVVATDFWTREPVVIDRGPLRPALRASMALPGIFTPVEIDGRVLVDGGLVNPIPFDLLHGQVDRIVAVDVLGSRSRVAGQPLPSALENVFQSFQIMEKAILREKRARFPPDIYFEPPIVDVAVLDFSRSEEIYAGADRLRPSFKRQLEEILARR